MLKVKRIHHVAVVVEEMEKSLSFWRDALGLDLSEIHNLPDQEAQVAFLPTGESEVELVKPTSDDSGIARYLVKHGPGMHHICMEVDDIRKMLVQLKSKGVHLINEMPMTTSSGRKFAFIHPESTGGVLVELYEA